MKAIIVYYSYSGNTEGVAKLIRDSTGYDMAAIKTVKPYVGTYDDVVAQGKRQAEAGFLPPIMPLDADISAYDAIFLGAPVWWYTVAPAVKTFLTRTNLEGKTIYPFVTDGGARGHAIEDIVALCKGATVKQGLDILFEGNRCRAHKKRILTWANML